MNATQISITDQQHWGDNWASPQPFEIEACASTMSNWPNAPITAKICEGTTPERAAYLLRQIADSLERNGRQWLPAIENHEGNQTEAVLSILESLEQRGYLAGVTQYDYSEPNAHGHCQARLNKLQTVRADHNPSVRVEILNGTDPKEAIALLKGILKAVKSDSKQPGAFKAEQVTQSGFPDDDGLPF